MGKLPRKENMPCVVECWFWPFCSSPESAVEAAVAALLKVTDTAGIVRWIEFRISAFTGDLREARFQAPFPGPERIQIVPGGRIIYPAPVSRLRQHHVIFPGQQ